MINALSVSLCTMLATKLHYFAFNPFNMAASVNPASARAFIYIWLDRNVDEMSKLAEHLLCKIFAICRHVIYLFVSLINPVKFD